MKQNNDISSDFLRQTLIGENGKAPSLEELKATEDALLAFANAHSVKPPLSMRDKILGKIKKLNEQKENQQKFTIENLPLLTPDSNWLEWQAAVASIPTPENYDDSFTHTLVDDEIRELHLVWVKECVPEEVHHELLESFILLEGTCECHVIQENGSMRKVRMREGDYISFKLGEVHEIHITSAEPAKAILQWLRAA